MKVILAAILAVSATASDTTSIAVRDTIPSGGDQNLGTPTLHTCSVYACEVDARGAWTITTDDGQRITVHHWWVAQSVTR